MSRIKSREHAIPKLWPRHLRRGVAVMPKALIAAEEVYDRNCNGNRKKLQRKRPCYSIQREREREHSHSSFHASTVGRAYLRKNTGEQFRISAELYHRWCVASHNRRYSQQALPAIHHVLLLQQGFACMQHSLLQHPLLQNTHKTTEIAVHQA